LLDFEGRVIMKFFVNEDGTISDISCIKAQGTKPYSKKFLALPESEQKAKEEALLKLMAKEGYRVVKNMPRWIPGNVSGKPVKTSFNLPITFKLTKKK
jgi:protein TonB